MKEYIDNKYIDNKYINKENGCYEEYFIDLIWATLDAWNMNSRSAKLAGIEVFRDNLKDNTEAIERLKNIPSKIYPRKTISLKVYLNNSKLFSISLN